MRHAQQMLLRQPDFEQVAPLARGAFAQVYKVTQRVSEHCLEPRIVRYLPKIKSLYAFQREKDLLHYLNQYPVFSRLYEVRSLGVGYFQVFEYRGEQTLERQALAQPFTEAEAALFLRQTLRALEIVHRLGFIHADIKPGNIIWHGQQATLIDWTQAIPIRPGYEAEHMIGDLLYSPPERMQGWLNEKSDIYSLGCTLYYALTGEHIYELDRQQSQAQHLYAHQFFVAKQHSKLSPFWHALILWMTQKSADERPSIDQVMSYLTSSHTQNFTSLNTKKEESFAYPSSPMSALAAEGKFFPLFKQAVALEGQGKVAQAMSIYYKLSLQGYSRAMNNLGRLYEQKKTRQDMQQAMQIYQQAYHKENPYATFNLGRLWMREEAERHDIEKAVQLFQFAALRGHKIAKKRLSNYYKKGIGVKSDAKLARFWALQAR